MYPSHDLPPLDCHAHISPDVTFDQIRSLAGAVVFGMTRTLREASFALTKNADLPNLVWGLGCHPGRSDADTSFDELRFRELLERSPLIGEVGLDRRKRGQVAREVFDRILALGKSHVLSVHSAGQQTEALASIEQSQHRGIILHWFTGSAKQIDQATSLGCYYSINAAMSDEQILRLPAARLLPETDFPSSRSSTRASRPADVGFLEARVATLLQMPVGDVRAMWYRNLGGLIHQSGSRERWPDWLVALAA